MEACYTDGVFCRYMRVLRDIVARPGNKVPFCKSGTIYFNAYYYLQVANLVSKREKSDERYFYPVCKYYR